MLCGGTRKISTSNGCRSMASVDSGLRPNASETCLRSATRPSLAQRISGTSRAFTFLNSLMRTILRHRPATPRDQRMARRLSYSKKRNPRRTRTRRRKDLIANLAGLALRAVLDEQPGIFGQAFGEHLKTRAHRIRQFLERCEHLPGSRPVFCGENVERRSDAVSQM